MLELLRKRLNELGKSADIAAELATEGMLRLNVVDAEYKDFNDENQTIKHYVSTESVDRHGDIVRAKGIDTANFAKNPVVLYGHDYYSFPVGKSLWQKVSTRNGVKGLLVETQFAKTPEGTLTYQLWKEGYLNASSIGFIPKGYDVIRGEADESGYAPIVGFDFTESELLEYSIVPVPANQDALRMAISKASGITDDVREKLLAEIEKAVIRYKKYPLCDEGEKWSGPKEVAAADVKDLKIMCTWFDDTKADDKGSYKLPHHRQSDKYTVFAGVKAAMGALLGARGGVNIPDGDKAGVHSHLAGHYKDFGKDAPPLKTYTDDELKSMFPEAYELSMEERFLDAIGKINNILDKYTDQVKNLMVEMKGVQEGLKNMNELMSAINDKVDQLPAEAISVPSKAVETSGDGDIDASSFIDKAVTGEVSKLTGKE